MGILKPLFVSTVISIVISPLIIKFAKSKNIVYRPRQDTMNKAPVPLLGGAVVLISLFGAIFLTGNSVGGIAKVFIPSVIVFSVGLRDDIRESGSSSYFRFLAHCLAAAIVISAGIKLNLFSNTILDYIFTILWVVGLTNAFNMLDGLDGLCSGIAGINAVSFLFIGLLLKQTSVIFIAAAILGSSSGYLFYNFSPAKIYLGSSGSTLLGFILAVVTILARGEGGNFVPVISLLLIFAIPIFDMCLTTYSRVKSGKVRSIKQWFDYKGKDHVHYRLLNRGLEVKIVVLFLLGISLLLGFVGVLYIKAVK